MIKLVVFDWNGTLLADTQAVLEGLNRELEILNRSSVSLKVFRQYYHIPLTEFYEDLGIGLEEVKANSQEMTKAFHSFYEPRVAKARTRTGARQVLKILKNRNLACVILSNHTIEGVYLQLERLRLTPYFDAVLANENIEIAHFKGKQERLEDYMAEGNLNPAEVVIVGDTVEETRIGKSLGLKTIAITGGYNSMKRLKAIKPDVLINKLHEIIPALENL